MVRSIRRRAIFGAVSACLAVLGGYFLTGLFDEKIGVTSKEKATPAVPLLPVRVAPDGWLIYQNARHKFSLFYPGYLTVREYSGAEDSLTVVFQSPERREGFQLFMVPYAFPQVSPERLKMDIPTGVQLQVEDIVIDGATGAQFYSKDLILGDTREIWLIRDKLLFEATAPKVLDEWLMEIMKTWKFDTASGE